MQENQPKRVLCVKTHLISTSFKTETESRLFQGCTTGVFGLPLCIRHRYPPLFGKEPKRDRQQIATHQASEKQMLPSQLRPTVPRNRDCPTRQAYWTKPNAGYRNDLKIEGRWRTERDSNPRYAFTYTRVPGVRLQPLGHLSLLSKGCLAVLCEAAVGADIYR